MKNDQKYFPVIGLEIHVELKTISKMFCGCRNDPFNAPEPNIFTCPVCLGLPGAIPVPNRKAIEWTAMLGLALGCEIRQQSKFDRKHYFYPDLSKGYQISQYDQPLAVNGMLTSTRKIRIRRVHLEEDTGKLLHRTIDGEKVTLVDFNRSGVPLVEIVTEPDIQSAGEAKEVAKEIHKIVRFLGISDADMEKGSMRLEANVSLQTAKLKSEQPSALPNYKVELKNINSFRFLERAIESELARQVELLSQGKVVQQQTRGWDSKTLTTKPQRTKEEAADYRYFPEPDIPPLRLTPQWISDLTLQITTLPQEVYANLVAAGVPEQAAEVLSSSKALADRALMAIQLTKAPVETRGFANWMMHHQTEASRMSIEELLTMYRQEKESVIGDEQQLSVWVDEAVSANQKSVEDYRNGKEQALGYLIGQVQRKAQGMADVGIVRKFLLQRLKS